MKLLRRHGRRALLRWAALSLAAGAALLVYARYVEPRWLRLRAWHVALPDLPPTWGGFRIVQLSDFHVTGPGVQCRTLQRAIRQAITLKPDLIVLTGDYMHRGRWRRQGEGLFEPLAAAAPTYAVLGNHDYRSSEADADRVAESLRRQGIRVLRNQGALVGPAGSERFLVGLDSWSTGHADLLQAVAEKPPGTVPLLVLCHEPDVIDTLPQGWFRLALAGHTHGAQIRLSPFARFSWLRFSIAEISSRYPRGFFTRGSLVLYVNQGLGMSELPLRFGARPEVSLFVLRRGGDNDKRPWQPLRDDEARIRPPH